MSNHEIIITGDQIFGHPSISTNHSDNTMTISRGEMFLKPTDEVKVTVNEDFTAVLWVHVNGVKFPPQNPGQTGTVQQDLSGLGECYLRFNGVFPGLPGQMILFTTEVGPFPQTFNGGPFCGCNVPCFQGDVKVYIVADSKYGKNTIQPIRVAELKAGMKISTEDGPRKILWIGKTISSSPLYEIAGDRFTAQHRILQFDNWTPAKKIGKKITLETPEPVYSILMKKHSVIRTTNRNLVETLLVRPRSLSQFSEKQQAEILEALMPIYTTN